MVLYNSAPRTFTVTPHKHSKGPGPAEEGEKKKKMMGVAVHHSKWNGCKTMTVNIQIETRPKPDIDC
jgi:hypothetical protein